MALEPDRITLIGVRKDGPLDGPDPEAGAAGAATLGRADGVAPFRGRGHLGWVQRHADADARSSGAALVHYTNGLAPLRSSVPYVITIQDLTFVRDPLHHPPQRLARIPFAFAAALGARMVVVPSRSSGRDVRRVLRVPANRIAVVGYAVRPQLAAAPAGEGRVTVLERHGLPAGGYVLALGGLDARKNPVRLVEAFERLAVDEPDLRLVLAGGDTWRHGLIRRRIRAQPGARPRHRRRLRSRRRPGRAAPRGRGLRLRLAQRGVRAAVLEAMQAGVPVVTSRISSMPEVARVLRCWSTRGTPAISRGGSWRHSAGATS